MFRDGACEFIMQRRCFASDTKRTRLHPAPCPTCDLSKLVGHERPHALAIKLTERRERDVINIKIKPHANRIGRH